MTENSLEIRTKVRMAKWQSIIKECRDSGMTVSEFCEGKNISCHAYYYWLRKIREYIACPNTTDTEFVMLPSITEISSSVSSALAVLQLKLKEVQIRYP